MLPSIARKRLAIHQGCYGGVAYPYQRLPNSFHPTLGGMSEISNVSLLQLDHLILLSVITEELALLRTLAYAAT